MPTMRGTATENLPNLIIVGAMKCATTSLHYWLNLHPEISMSREKELNFFVREMNWQKGIAWYKSHFRRRSRIRGESSHNYTYYPFFGGVPERMHSVVPEAKLIYILRDPMDRIVSHYIQNYSDGREDRTIEEALKDAHGRNQYGIRSKYFIQLRQYLDYFPDSNILVLTLENLRREPRKTLGRVFRFLGVDDTFYSPKFSTIKHKSSEKRRKNRVGMLLKQMSQTRLAKVCSADVRRSIGRALYLPFSHPIQRPVLDEGLKAEMIDYLKEDIGSLRQYTGYYFEDWCV